MLTRAEEVGVATDRLAVLLVELGPAARGEHLWGPSAQPGVAGGSMGSGCVKGGCWRGRMRPVSGVVVPIS